MEKEFLFFSNFFPLQSLAPRLAIFATAGIQSVQIIEEILFVRLVS
jgi:hypothetical protein